MENRTPYTAGEGGGGESGEKKVNDSDKKADLIAIAYKQADNRLRREDK